MTGRRGVRKRLTLVKYVETIVTIGESEEEASTTAEQTPPPMIWELKGVTARHMEQQQKQQKICSCFAVLAMPA